MKLNCIRLLVNDFDKCFRFYSEDLGLQVTWGEIGGEYASFDIGLPSGLSIFKSDLMAEAIGNSHKSLPSDNREKFVIAVEVDNVDRSFKELSRKGVTFVNEPRDMTGWGMRTVHLSDPEGNLIELWTELAREKWDKDLVEKAEEYSA